MLFNLHTHCNFCDGAGEPEEYVTEALKKGFFALGLSSHAPIPFAADWTLNPGNKKEYYRTIDLLKDKYKNSIQIYKGLEIDYFQGDDRNAFLEDDLDYTIGSIHFINKEGKKEYYSVDGSLKDFEKALNICSDRSIKKLVRRYYELLLEMLGKNRFGILGHLDIVKKHNLHNRYFNEQEHWYADLVKDVIKMAAEYDVVVEVNTGGIARGYTEEVYPSPWIIRECQKRGVPVTLCSDAHSPDALDFYFAEAKSIIKSAGYDEIWGIKNKEWINMKI